MEDITLNVFYVRHMYSCANYKKKKGSLTFWLIKDPSLHCVGIEQAKLLGDDFKSSNLKIDMICTSQMFRAIQTGIIMRNQINKNIPLRVVRHINERGITPDNVPEKFKKITEEDSKKINIKIDYNTENKTSFKRFEKNVLPDILNSLTSKEKKKEYTIIVVSHSHLLNKRFNKNLDNGQMVYIKYVFTPERMMLSEKELNIPKELSSPYMNNQFFIYECTSCEDTENLLDDLVIDELEKKMEIERFIIKKDKYETYKFRKSKDNKDMINMIVVKIPDDLSEKEIEKYLSKYRYDKYNNYVAGIKGKLKKEDLLDIKKNLVESSPSEDYNIVFLS